MAINKYRRLMPIALPAALVISVLYTVKGRMDTNAQYRQFMQEAQAYMENGVVADAITSYNEALALHPTMEVYQAVGNVYMAQEEYRDAVKWYEREMLPAYPTNPQTYQFGISAQLARGNNREAFKIYDNYKNRGLQSDAVEEQIRSVWYSFDLLGGYDAVGAFSNNTPVAAVQDGETWGYVDTAGKVVLHNDYLKAGTFGEVAAVVDEAQEAYYIDIDGNKKITASYFVAPDDATSKITEFKTIESGLVLAYDGQSWSYYSADTHQKIFGGYRDATLVTNGVGAVSQNGADWALVTADGQQITGYDFLSVLVDKKGVPCRCDALLVKKGADYLLVDKTGTPISQTGYEDARAFNEETLAAVKKAGRWIFVAPTGEETDLGDFEELQSFSAGLAAAKQNGLWGYINESGEWAIQPQFEEADAFNSTGVAFVKTEEDTWKLLSLYRYHHK